MMDNNNQTNDQVVNDQAVNNQAVNSQNVNNQTSDQVNNKREEKGKGRFYGILAFAIFIIMAVGATFAYFTASTNSATGSVRTGSASLELEYISYTSAWLSDKLIPVRTNVVEYSVEQRPDSQGNKICLDDNGEAICSIYVFQVKNTALSDQTVSINLASESNTFGNLTAMIYEINKDTGYVETAASDDPLLATTQEQYDRGEGFENYVQVQNANGEAVFDFSPIYINRLGVRKTLLDNEGVKSVAVAVPKDGEENAKLASDVVIPGTSSSTTENDESNVKTFMIVLYINETEDNQNESDANKEFSGIVIVDGSDGSTGVTGRINALDESVLQNQPTTTTDTTTTDTTTTDTTTTEGP